MLKCLKYICFISGMSGENIKIDELQAKRLLCIGIGWGIYSRNYFAHILSKNEVTIKLLKCNSYNFI